MGCGRPHGSTGVGPTRQEKVPHNIDEELRKEPAADAGLEGQQEEGLLQLVKSLAVDDRSPPSNCRTPCLHAPARLPLFY